MSVAGALTIGGMALGSAFGPIGAAIGGALGGVVGGLISGPVHSSQAILEDLGALKLDYGSTWPRIYGRYRFKITPIWSSEKRPIAHDEEIDAKGGPSAVNTSYTYEQDWLCWAPINATGWARIWRNGELIATRLADSDDISLAASVSTSAWASVTFFDGAADQMPWSVYEAAVGTENASAYRHRPTLAFESLDLGSSGQASLIEVEFYTAGDGDGQGFIESFDDGLDDWAVFGIAPVAIVSGPFGNALQFPGGTRTGEGTSVIRSITPTDTGYFSFYVRLDDFPSVDINVEDAPILQLMNGGTENLAAFIPARELAIDSLQRPHVTLGTGDPTPIGTTHLAVGTWYAVVIRITSATTVSVTITNISSGAVFATATIAGSFSSWNGTHLKISDQFALSGSAIKPGASYDEIIVGSPSVDPGPVDLADIVRSEALLEWTGETGALAADDIDVSELEGTLVTGVAFTGSPREAIAALMDVYYFQAVCSDKLYFRFRGAASAATIPFEDSGAGVGSPAEPFCGLERGNDLEVALQVAFTAPGLLRDYEPDTQHSDRLIGESFELRQYQSPVVFEPAEAKGRADTMVYDARVAAHTGQLALGDEYVALEPTDVVTAMDDEGNTYRVRIERETFADGVRSFDVVLDDPNVLLSSGITAETDQRAVTITPPASTELFLLDTRLLRDADDVPGHYAGMVGSGRWPGGVGYRSTSETGTYERIFSVTTSAVAGFTTTTLPDWTGGNVFDESSVVRVQVSGGTLSSSTRDAVLADRSVNAFAIGDHGRWEIVQAVNATLVSPGVYDLSGLLRGRLGTEYAMGSHEAADRVVKLQAAGLRSVEQQASEIGSARYWKGVTVGATLDSATAETFTAESERLKPSAPVDLRCSRDGSGSFTITWARRSRYASELFASVPLGESSEAYEVDILDGADVVRTISATSETCQYTPAQQVADFGAVQSSIDVAVYQMSATVGRGYPLTGTLSTSYTPTGQVNTITLAGTFAAGVPISVYANGVLVASRTSVGGDTNLAGVATGLASVIDATANYAASAVGNVVTVTGPLGSTYTLTAIVGGSSYISIVKTQDAAVANPGTSYRGELYISNLSTGITDPVPAGVTFRVTVKENGLTVSTFDYTTTASMSKDSALAGLIGAFADTDLGDSGYSMNMDSTTAGGSFAVLSGPVGTEGISLTTYATAPWGLTVSVQSEGSPAVAENQPQVVQVTVSGTPANGEVFRVTLGGENFNYTATVPSDTRTEVLAGLVSVIDADADYSAATVSASKLEATGAVIGDYTYSVGITRGITATVA